MSNHKKKAISDLVANSCRLVTTFLAMNVHIMTMNSTPVRPLDGSDASSMDPSCFCPIEEGSPCHHHEKTPGATVGAGGEGSGTEPWPADGIEGAIQIVESKGLKLGTDVKYIQNAGGKVYYYGKGTSSGAGGPEMWTFSTHECVSFDPPRWDCKRNGGAVVGEHGHGSGQDAWPEDGIVGAIKIVEKWEGQLGTNITAIQESDGKCYFYGPGDSSGAAGPETWTFTQQTLIIKS